MSTTSPFCLSVRQPWAWAVLAGYKRIEYRTRSTHYRGLLVIHASAGPLDPDGLSRHRYSLPDDLPRGAFVGTVRLRDCRPAEGGGFEWVLDRPQPFAAPVPGKGRLGLFRLPSGVILPVPGLAPSPA